MSDSITAVREFEQIIGYKKEGTFIKLYTEAVVDGRVIRQGNEDCRISYNIGYEQYNVAINWNMSDTVMHNLGLHGSYNTNYQTMTVKKNALIIKGDGYQIRLWKE